MDYLPIFCRLDNKPVLLIGGGEVAERKARLLLDAGPVHQGAVTAAQRHQPAPLLS